MFIFCAYYISLFVTANLLPDVLLLPRKSVRVCFKYNLGSKRVPLFGTAKQQEQNSVLFVITLQNTNFDRWSNFRFEIVQGT